MIVQSNALSSRPLKLACSFSLSATRSQVISANLIPPRRCYANPFSSHGRRDTILQDPSQDPASTCWSLLSPSSSEIAEKISSLKVRKAKLASGKTPLVVLLVTPAHIRLLDDGNNFIPSLFQLAVEKTKSWQIFDLLAAVVDRIPHTSLKASHAGQDSHTSNKDSATSVRVEDGFQGISVAVLDSETAAPDLWSPRVTSSERETMTIQQRCVLSFSFHPSPGVRTQIADKTASQPLVKRTVHLPVANTLFQNGKTSTLFAQRWEVIFDKNSVSESMSSKKTWLPQQTIDMSAVFTDEGMRLQFDHLLHSRLMPITPARTITAAVGNIVRKISGDDVSGGAISASEELERAISTAIEQGRIPAQQAGVWALIRPQRYAVLDRASELQGTVRDMIEYAVLSGARLHKVLSGGGGWGEKHGLLALDPDSDYRHQDRAFKSSLGDDQDVELEKRKSLGEVVKPGDVIAFYVYKSHSDANPTNLHKPWIWHPSQTAATLIFGSLPSTMDDMQEVDITRPEAKAQTELNVEEDHFGMLSEQGMSLESSFLLTNLTANRMQYLRPELQRQVYEVRRERTVTTKLDAPYTLLSIRGLASRISVSSEFKEEEVESHDMDLNTLMPPEPSTATAVTKSVPALVQKLPKSNDQDQGAQRQRQTIWNSLRDDRVLAQFRKRTEEQISKLTRKEQRAKKIAASKVLPKAAIHKVKEEMVVAEIAMIAMRHPKMNNKAVRMKAKKAVDHKFEHTRLTLQDLAILMPKPSIDSRDSSGTHEAAPEEEDDVEHEHGYESRSPPNGVEYKHERRSRPDGVGHGYESRSPPDDINYEDERHSVSVINEEGEGKDPGSPHVGKDGNIFMIRRHATMNPFERLQAIQKAGEIRHKEQAVRGLHGQYHLVFENQLEEERKS